MKKTLIALAIAGLSFNAAAVDFTTPNTTASYASEISLPAVLNDTNVLSLDVITDLGFSATGGVKRYVRVDLTNATFKTAVKAADVTAIKQSDGQQVPLTPSVSVGGTADSDYVVIEITPATTLANVDKLRLNLADINALGGDIDAKYRLYETGVDAAAGTDSVLAMRTGKLVNFKSALSVKTTKKGDVIDVVSGSTKFVDDDTVDTTVNATVGKVVIEPVAHVLLASGFDATIADLVSTYSLELSGDFSSGLKAGVLLDKNAVKWGTEPSTTLTSNKATFASPAPVGGFSDDVIFTVDGKTAIASQDMTLKFKPVSKAGYTVSDIDLGVLGSLTKNGATAEANFVLAPDTSYNNLVRISNTSGIEGKFFITMINDDGKSVTFPLSAVKNTSGELQPESLKANASSKQMNVQAIFDAAVATDATFSASGDKKMRLKVEGEVGSLSLQNYTISKDGNALNTMNAF